MSKRPTEIHLPVRSLGKRSVDRRATLRVVAGTYFTFRLVVHEHPHAGECSSKSTRRPSTRNTSGATHARAQGGRFGVDGYSPRRDPALNLPSRPEPPVGKHFLASRSPLDPSSLLFSRPFPTFGGGFTMTNHRTRQTWRRLRDRARGQRFQPDHPRRTDQHGYFLGP